ncbi:hypothetical protein [Chitinophaga sp. YIM B06452]|uniref:hypothetical protein n=1 Tax=Chitinophaga sp. YIM B06452 TaxID=3082158 RepID=UPI0031FE76E7
MPFLIFYSWQSHTESKYNKNFIEDCIKSAIKKLRADYQLNKDYFILDKDTKDVPGMPNIPTKIREKISQADVFIGDITFTGVNDGVGMSNPNVLIELGYAEAAIGTERVVTVFNLEHGDPKDMPFDLIQSRFPICYKYSASIEKEQVKKILVDELSNRIGEIFKTELERQRKENAPFENWITWSQTVTKHFGFEVSPYTIELFGSLDTLLATSRSVVRLVGLAGCGKTRLLFEYFRLNPEDAISVSKSNKVLYVDCNQNIESEIISTLKQQLIGTDERVFIVDNCPSEFHAKAARLLNASKSKSCLVTIGIDPNESGEEVIYEFGTNYLRIDLIKNREVVKEILTSNFQEFQAEEIQLLVNFSNGLPLLATIMAKNPNRGKNQPGTLRQADLIERLLGDLHSDKNKRNVITACSLFASFGLFDDYEVFSNAIALDKDICGLVFPDANEEDLNELKINFFRQICSEMLDRQLLERVGRTVSFRPTPLALSLAEEWWRSCTTTKFERVRKFLSENKLVESFCKQFQYLKHLDNAKRIVADLCNGPFRNAEVLNSEAGSRLFRSFVHVNPDACVSALYDAFKDLSEGDISDIKEGRRNLVWALEVLCFSEKTFYQAVKVLIKFAVGENEPIANNATAHFLQLFHIYLPGTTANLEIRKEVLAEVLSSSSERARFLGIEALNAALKSDSFHRMGIEGGGRFEGDMMDFKPKSEDIRSYWNWVLDQLFAKVGSGSKDEQEKALAIIVKKLYSLTEMGLGNIVLPRLSKVLGSDQLDRVDLKNRVSLVLSRGTGSEADKQKLEDMLKELEPRDFEEKVNFWLRNPSSAEKRVESGEGRELLQLSRYGILKDDLMSNQALLRERLPYLAKGGLVEGFQFGWYVSQHIDREELWTMLISFINVIKEIEENERNFVFLMGLMHKCKDSQIVNALMSLITDDLDICRYSFLVAKTLELPIDKLLSMLDMVKNGQISPIELGHFSFGWGVKHLDKEEVFKFFESAVDSPDECKVQAFNILVTWVSESEESWSLFRDTLLEYFSDFGEKVLYNLRDNLNEFYIFQFLEKALTELNDSNFADVVCLKLFETLRSPDHYIGRDYEYKSLFRIIKNKYFSSLWHSLSEVFENADANALLLLDLRDILGSSDSSFGVNDGILFEIDDEKFEIILQWCIENKEKELSFVSQMLPVIDTRNAALHRYAQRFIDDLGENESILDGLSARMGTFTWVGSLVEKLEIELRAIEKLESHVKPKVREWAANLAAYYTKRINYEKNKDDELANS